MIQHGNYHQKQKSFSQMVIIPGHLRSTLNLFKNSSGQETSQKPSKDTPMSIESLDKSINV